MYFWFFKLKKWGKKTAETRRRNCAVLPKRKIPDVENPHPGKTYPYRYLVVLTLTPGPMVETTVQERIY